MKKTLLGKLGIFIILLVFVIGGYSLFRINNSNWFKGTTSEDYSFVIKRFSKKKQLLVADAEVYTTKDKKFESAALKHWPSWTKYITSVFVSRNLVLTLPIKTEFKLELKDLDKKDILVKDNVLTFKKPLVVYVDSQQEGKINIKKTSNGLIDKAVDAFTSGKKAQEFLSEKSQDIIYATSKKVMSSNQRRKKVAKYAEEALESLINLNSDEHEKVDVNLKVSDLKFVNHD